LAQLQLQHRVLQVAHLRADWQWQQGLPMALARVSLGVLWLSNLPSKIPVGSSCGVHGNGVLCTGMQTMAAHSIIGPYGQFIRAVVLPHYRFFALLTLSVEWLAGMLLLFGFCTRVGAALGLAQSLNLFVGLAFAPGEWVWPYALMALLHLLILGQARHYLALDALLMRPARAATAAPARLSTQTTEPSGQFRTANPRVAPPAQATRTAIIRPIEGRR
jgi:uncharacterized membrane protein YphA (DoxX/SURF4 family)